MLITDSNELKAYTSEKRTWQGIPGIERTKGGRIFVTFYSGGISEQRGNYVLLVKSDDSGKCFSEPIAVSDLGEDARAYDPTLWIDPLGRLWFFWSVIPDNRVEFTICNDPDADVLAWEPVRTSGFDVMLNKPTVLKNGDWLFPCAVWDSKYGNHKTWEPEGHPSGAHVFVSRDKGKTFSLLGTATGDARSFDEHMILEQKDGTLAMYLRMKYGVGFSESRDGGSTWTKIRDSGLQGPCSRIHIRRLRSGRVLLINHCNYTGRNNLTALLSEDDGKTFPYSLLLDERDNVSYPDVTESENGELYIVYDRERGAQYREDTDYSNHAREILMARVTEKDICNGALISPNSQLKTVVSRLGYRPKP